MALSCKVLKKEMKINCKIEEIYRDEISLQTAQNLLEIENTRKSLLENKK